MWPVWIWGRRFNGRHNWLAQFRLPYALPPISRRDAVAGCCGDLRANSTIPQLGKPHFMLAAKCILLPIRIEEGAYLRTSMQQKRSWRLAQTGTPGKFAASGP